MLISYNTKIYSLCFNQLIWSLLKNRIENSRSRTTELQYLRWGWGRVGRLGEKGRWGKCMDGKCVFERAVTDSVFG